MVRIAREKDIFTIVYVFNEKESRAMAEAGADCIISHVGLTVGGMIGTTKSLTIEESAQLTGRIMEAGKAVRDDIIWLAHGGPLATPKDFAAFRTYLPEIDGFVGASSMERIPTEEAIVKTVREFKPCPKGVLCPKGYQAKPGGFLRTASEFQQSEYQGYQANPTIPNNNRINTTSFSWGNKATI